MADDFFVPDEPIEEIVASFKRGRKGKTRIPTNDELAERARDMTELEIVRGWLDRHVGQPIGFSDATDTRDKWLDWAAQNFLADPEVKAWLSIAAQRSYQRGYEDGRRAQGGKQHEVGGPGWSAVDLD